VDEKGLRAKYKSLAPELNERARRIWAATEAREIGRGGIALVSRATKISYSTIVRGLHELKAGESAGRGRVRRFGGGRKSLLVTDPSLLNDLEGLVEPTASGDPESPLRWTSKSVRMLATHLNAGGHSEELMSTVKLQPHRFHADWNYTIHPHRKPR
jgi:Rhodopirellula transposase DDE domain